MIRSLSSITIDRPIEFARVHAQLSQLFSLKQIIKREFFFLLADSQDVDLDAILGELCALERRCDGDIASTPAPDAQRAGRPNSGRINTGDSTDIGKNDGGMFNSIYSFGNTLQ